jgi:hypothetical protein
MRPYGITRVEYYDTDCGGNRANGRASHFNRRPGRSGDIRASQRPAGKATARRHLARRARAAGKAEARAKWSDLTDLI